MFCLTNKRHQPRLFPFLLSTLVFIQTAGAVFADELSSPNYIIRMGTINIITGGGKTGPAARLTDTVGQTIQGRFEDTGYRLQSGFQFGSGGGEPFSLILSDSSVNFGAITPNRPTQTSIDLTINGVGVHGYTVSAIEDHQLQTQTQKTIPDTDCDPQLRCTPTQAAPWTSTTAYGFGYSLSGTDVNQTVFVDQTYFRPFANNAKNQNPAPIMASSNARRQATATLTFQINVSPTQPSGTYQNAIQLIALPSF